MFAAYVTIKFFADRRDVSDRAFAIAPGVLQDSIYGGQLLLGILILQRTGLATVNSPRGAACGDLFNDGRIDVVVNNLDGVPTCCAM